MSIALLGPLRVGEDGSSVSPRDRAVLVALALRPGTVVSPEGLADALWDGTVPPRTWSKIVQGSVMRLRRVLGGQAIETTTSGYRLVLHGDELDIHTFERLVERAGSLAELGEHERAVITLDEALGLWRGAAFGDLNDWPPAHAAAVHLDELRQAAEESRLRSLLFVTAPEAVVGQARTLVSLQPLREHRWILLARALYASGRQGEALAALRQAGEVMREELGLDVSPELADLAAAILRHDPALLLPGAARAPRPDGSCPYPGLRAFGTADGDWFFGRDREVAACLVRLADHPLVLIVGPSGSGKSSLLRAGVVARLEARGRRCRVITPGADPLAGLAAARGDLPVAAVLVVDQLEEVFVAQGGAQASAFLDQLAAHVSAGGAVLAAMRGDHVIDLGVSQEFAHGAEHGLHIVTALDEVGLREAIEGPARLAGLRLEPGLVDLLVRDALGEPGGLPLLSHALVETWERREGRTLTVEGYRSAGGIRGAVAQSAERVYASLPQPERETVRAMLLRLVAPSPDGEPTSTRVATEVMRRDHEHERLLDLLVRARLLTTDDRTVAVAHESLGRAWPRLRGWLDEDLEGQRLLRHLASTAVEWEVQGRPESELYRGARLQSVQEWAQREQPDLTSVEHDFIRASRAATDEQERAAAALLQRERRHNRTLRWLLTGTVGALVIALVAGLLAWTQQHSATRSALEADARRLGAQAATEEKLDRALLLAVQGVRLHRDTDTERNVLNAVTRSPHAVRVVHGDGDQLFEVTVSPDGALVAVGDDDGTVRILDAGTGAPVVDPIEPPADEPVQFVTLLSFSPDLRRLLVGSNGLRLLTLEGGATRSTVLAPADSRSVDGELGAWFKDAVWSPDGKTVTVLHGRDGVSSWDATTGRRTRQGLPWPQDVEGEQLVGEDAAFVWGPSGLALVDVVAGSVRRSIDGAGGPFALSPDGTRLVSADPEVLGGIVLWDMASGARLQSAQPQTSPVQALGFAPGGGSIAMGSADRAITILDADTLVTRDRLSGHGGDINDLTFGSPDELWSVASDGKAIAWDLGAAGGVARTVTAGLGETGSGRVSPDASLVAYTTPDGAIRTYDVAGRTELIDLPSMLAEGGFDSDFSADGRVFATLDYLGNVRAVDLTSGRPRPPMTVAPSSNALALSEDGSRLVVGTREGISIWDTTSGTEEASAPTPDWVLGVELDRTNRWIFAATSNNNSVVVFDASSLETEATLVLDGAPLSFALSPDLRTLAVGAFDSTITFFDTASWHQVDQVAVGEALGILTWDHAGERFAAVGLNGQLTVWDGRSRTQLASIQLDRGFIAYAGFTADDSTLVTLTRAGRIVEWELALPAVIAHACAVAGRDLTRAEWEQYLPDRPYERTCPSAS